MMALTQLSDFYLKSLQMHRWPVASAWGHSLGPTLTYNENDSKTNGLKCLLGSGASYPRESRRTPQPKKGRPSASSVLFHQFQYAEMFFDFSLVLARFCLCP